MVCGDFNLPKINWYYQDHLQYLTEIECDAKTKLCASLIWNFYSKHNFDQVFPNYSGKTYTLDLLFAEHNTMLFHHSLDQLVPVDKQHHDSAIFILHNDSNNLLFNHSETYDYLRMNVEDLLTCLKCIDWDKVLIFDTLGVNGVTNLFYDLLHCAIDICVPKFGVAPRKFPYWYSPVLKKTF